jgi:hypothetical protein
MSKQQHDREHGDQVVGVIEAAQTGTTLMVGHIYGPEGGAVVNLMMGRHESDPEAILLDADTADKVVTWLQQAIAMCRTCGSKPDPSNN